MRLGISKRNRKLNILIWLIIIVLIIMFLYFADRMENAFVKYARSYANGIATTAVSKAVYKTFEDYTEEDFSSVTDKGKAVMFDTNTAKVNIINSKLTDNLQDYVVLEDYQTTYIPVGTVLGIAALSGAGPKMPVRIHPVNIVNTDVNEVFESCGINQVRHSVSISVEIIMSYSGYTFSTEEVVSVTVPVTDTIIVGDTPQYYGNGNMGVTTQQEVNNE